MTEDNDDLLLARDGVIWRITFDSNDVPQQPVMVGDSGLHIAGLGKLNGVVYATDSAADTISTINTQTGAATHVGDLDPILQPVGLTGVDEGYLHDTPALYLETPKVDRENVIDPRTVLVDFAIYPWVPGNNRDLLRIYADFYRNVNIRQIIGIR